MTTPDDEPNAGIDFVVRGRFGGPDLVGARWWNQSFETFAKSSPLLDRRVLLGGSLALGAALIGGIVLCNRDDETEVSLAALELQKREGWNAGHADRSLVFPADMVPVPSMVNAIGMLAMWPDLQRMADRLTPEPHLSPYAITTLFQALADPKGLSALRTVHTPAMDTAYGRGVALRDLLAEAEVPPGIALIVDLPGPEAVALAAGLADRFCPVFTFDNWPHPLGVVPSHWTLGACAYYLPLFDVAAQRRTPPSMPVFVLDANRLNPYRDEPNQFDNRYVAPVPSAASLTSLGIKRLLYLRPDGASLTELDDLNADFVAWEQAGLEVRAVALSDFTAQQAAATETTTTTMPSGGASYYYGGQAHYHPHFWSSYGWSQPVSSSRRLVPAPSGLSNAAAYRPAFRPTIFATRTIGGAAGIGKQKPSGFGRVSVRMSGGQVQSFGGNRIRSGSFARSRSSSYG
jgi:hypothetical protein